MNALAMTWTAIGFWWVMASLVIAGAWCASIEITRWHMRRRDARRRAARGGFIYDRNRDRLPL